MEPFMKRKSGYISRLAAIAMAAFAAFAVFAADEKPAGNKTATATEQDATEEGYAAISKLMFVIQKIRDDYVDADKTEYDKLITDALRGMIRGLDPFSSYMDNKDFKMMIQDTEGKEFGGVGLAVNYKNNTLIVITPVENSPAFKAGIKPGDIITEIEGNKTSTMTFEECIKMMKGEPGTEVKITISRESDNSNFTVTLKRELIEMSTVTGAKTIGDGIAYLNISQFNAPTATDLDKALKKLSDEGMKALVIDLRGNPGGLLTSAIEVSSRFVKTGELVVYTEGKLKSSKFDYYSVRCNKYLELPVAILVDRYSASASEIVAGCLQDRKKAVLVGERTYGKGSVQTIFPMPDNNGAVRLTIAKYYTPSSRVIHENGIDPTVLVPSSEKEIFELYRQRQSYPGMVKPPIKNVITDVQLQRAIDILKGIRIFEDTIYGK